MSNLPLPPNLPPGIPPGGIEPVDPETFLAGLNAIDLAESFGVVASTALPAAGEPVLVTVLKPVLRAVPLRFDITGSLASTVTGALSGTLDGVLDGSVTGAVGGAIDGTVGGTTGGTFDATSTLELLSTATSSLPTIGVRIRYEVRRGGAAAHGSEYRATPSLPAAGSHPLEVAFLFLPQFIDELAPSRPREYEIVVNVDVTINGVTRGVSRSIPVVVDPIRLPAILLLSQHARKNDASRELGQVLVMVKSVSSVTALSTLITTLNALSTTISRLRTVLGFTASALVDPFGELLEIIKRAPAVYFKAGDAPVLNDFGGDLAGIGGFDDEASALFLVGPLKTRAAIYTSEDFETGWPHESRTFELRAVHDIGPGALQTNIGYLRMNDFGSLNDEVESVRWLPDSTIGSITT